jgi:hypothetical protein
MLAQSKWLLLLGLALPFSADAAVWIGNISDLGCAKTKSGGKGPNHAACARLCVHRGEEYVIVTDDGTIYRLKPQSGDDRTALTDEIDGYVSSGYSRLEVEGTVEAGTISVVKLKPRDAHQ